MARRAGFTTCVAGNPWHAGLMPEGITEKQHHLVTSWLGRYEVVADQSWPLQDTTVLQVKDVHGHQLIIKASETSHHIRREIAAYSRGMPGLEGRVPVLLHAAADARLLVTRFLPGTLVAGSNAEQDPETYRQAGSILAALHQPAGISHSYVRALKTRTGSIIKRAVSLLPGRPWSSSQWPLMASCRALLSW